jgi:site-specific DNA-methyltransferase (adenine-specific)
MRKEQIGNATLYLGDCLDILPTLDKVDAVVTDPPYGITNCEWDKAVALSLFWDITNFIVSFCGEPYTSKEITVNLKHFKEKLIWEKHRPANFANGKYRHLKYTEDIIILAKNKYTFNPQKQPRISDRFRQAQKGNSKQRRTKGSDVSFKTTYPPRDWNTFDADWKLPSNILKFPGVVNNAREKTEHPTQKPLSLMKYLILTYSNVNQIIIDPFMGSGTTGVACVELGRRFIGIEINEKYFDIACKRIEQAVSEDCLCQT